MSLSEKLRPLVDGLPDEAMVTLPVRALRHWLTDDDAERSPRPEVGGGDLTIGEVARLMHRSESTVRGWLNGGHVPGAYKLRGRAWRVPRAALSALRTSAAPPEKAGHARWKVESLAWR